MSEELPDVPDAEVATAPSYGAPSVPPPRSTRDELTEPAQMSPLARLANVFFSPGDVFADVRRSPRDWWLPLLITAVIVAAAFAIVPMKLGLTPEDRADAGIEMRLKQQGKTMKDLSPDERKQFEAAKPISVMIEKLMPAFIPVGILVSALIGAGIYRLILLVMQAQTTYFRVLSVLTYSYYATGTIKSVLAIIVAFLKTPGDIDAETYIRTRDIVAAGPAAFVSQTAHPVLRTFLANFDVFNIWLAILIAIGLAAVSRKLKLGTATGIVVAIFIFWTVVTTLIAYATQG